MKLAGVIFDFYDDPSGSVLKTYCPTPEDVPEIVKEAYPLNEAEREVLRDDAFALIMVDNGKVFRKFACVDPGNTMLSMMYFEAVKDRLPEEAQKTAAANLSHYAERYNLNKFAKASGKARTRDPMNQPMVGDEADWAARTNLVSIRGGADSGRVIPTANQMKTAEDMGSSVVLTNDKRNIGVSQKTPPLQNHTAIGKNRTGGGLLQSGDVERKAVKHTQVEQGGVVKVGNVVDVSSLSPKVKIEKRAAKNYALNDRYPLDSYSDVAAAISYFEDNYRSMDQKDRHEYAVKTASRADELGVSLTPAIERYGSTEYAPDVEAHLAARRAAVADADEISLYKDLSEKRASVEPEQFAELLAQVDEVTGLDFHYGGIVADAYFSTFGGNTEKEKAAEWTWKSDVGDLVNARMLHKLALNGRKLVHKHFSAEISDAFMKDPITIFESLPAVHKKIIAHMAQDEFDNLPNN